MQSHPTLCTWLRADCRTAKQETALGPCSTFQNYFWGRVSRIMDTTRGADNSISVVHATITMSLHAGHKHLWSPGAIIVLQKRPNGPKRQLITGQSFTTAWDPPKHHLWLMAHICSGRFCNWVLTCNSPIWNLTRSPRVAIDSEHYESVEEFCVFALAPIWIWI